MPQTKNDKVLQEEMRHRDQLQDGEQVPCEDNLEELLHKAALLLPCHSALQPLGIAELWQWREIAETLKLLFPL